MTKKTLIIIATSIAAIIGIIIFIIYNPAKKPQKIENPNQDNISLSHLSADGQSLYYLNQNQDVLRRWNLQNNKIEDLVKLPKQNIDEIKFTPDETKVFIHWTNPENARDNYYWMADLNEKKIVAELSNKILNLAISPDNRKIAYHYFDWDNNQNFLGIANLSGTNPEEVRSIEDEFIEIAWIDNQNFIYYPLLSEAGKVKIKKINLEKKQAEIIAADVFVDQIKILKGANYQNKILVEMTDKESADYQLAVYDGQKNQFVGLNISSPAELVAQLNQDQIYTPYFDKDSQFSGLMRIDITTGKKKQHSNYYLKKYELSEFFVTPDEKFIYFISGGNLYKINL